MLAGIQVDWTALARSLAVEVTEGLRPVVEGAYDDLKLFGFAIARDMVFAIQTGSDVWQSEIRAQVRAIAEITRIRLNEAQWNTAERVLGLVFRTAVGALGAVVKA